MERPRKSCELHQAHTENRHLKETIGALREELEKTHIRNGENIQKALASLNDENTHLKLTIVTLRDQMEREKISHEERIQKLEQKARDEMNHLRETIRTLRTQMEAYEKDQKPKSLR